MESSERQESKQDDDQATEPDVPDLYECLTRDIPEGVKFEKMNQFDALRDGIDLIFEGGAIKDFYYDEFPELAPSEKDAIADQDFAHCELIKNENIKVVSYGKDVLRGVYSMQRDLEVATDSAKGIRNGEVIMQVEPVIAVVDKAMIKQYCSWCFKNANPKGKPGSKEAQS